MRMSVIIPAHNEEKFIGACLNSIRLAELGSTVEIIVCLNRCTDTTEEIAKSFNALIVREDARNLSKIRNAGVSASTGEIIVTIDADSLMSPNMLSEVQRLVASQKFIGGGTRIKLERFSFGILASSLVVIYYAFRFGLRSAGLFWCLRKNFDEIGGFNENLLSLEDLDFANRLALLGKKRGLRYGTAWRAYITTSCRKFDKYGDWYFFKNPRFVRDIFSGTDKKSTDQFFYDPER